MPIAGRKKRSSKLPVLLVAPALVLLALFTFAPAGYAVYLSLMKLHVTGGLLGTSSTQVFAGLSNYADTFHDPEFWHSLGRMLLIAVIGVPSTVILATVFALCLDANAARLTTVTRLAIFLPYAVPGVIASILWGFLYLPATSPIGGSVFSYFGNRAIFFTVANVAVWGVVGFNTVVLYTALRALPRDIRQAAEIDGASELQIALRVKLPQIAPGDRDDRAVQRDRRPAAVQRAHGAQAADQRDHLYLGAADARLLRRVRQQQHLRRCRQRVHAAGHDRSAHRRRRCRRDPADREAG